MKKKFIVIDSATYWSFFGNIESSGKLVELIKKLVTNKEEYKVLLPQQIKDEIIRNKNSSWLQSKVKKEENKISQCKSVLKKMKEDESDISSFIIKIDKDKIIKRIKRKIKEREKRVLVLNKDHLSVNSKANINLNKILKFSEVIKENKDILENAFYRREKGNPPYEKEEEKAGVFGKLGDRIIWESLVYFIKEESEKGNLKDGILLYFVSADKSAWESQDNKFNDFLLNEFKDSFKKSEIIFSKSLADIYKWTEKDMEEIKLIDEESEKKEKEAEFKKRAIVEIKKTGSFVRANEVMSIISNNRRYLDNDLSRDILKNVMSNDQFWSGAFGFRAFILFLKEIDDVNKYGIFEKDYIDSISNELSKKVITDILEDKDDVILEDKDDVIF